MRSFVLCTVILALALINTGEAVQCWECSSNSHGRCADYFNMTMFPRTTMVYTQTSGNPRVVNCDSGPAQYGQYGYSRQVCMKLVETDRRFHETIYTRQCHTLIGNEKVGTCPSRPSNGDRTVDFCEYCDTHECNASQNLRLSFWLGFVSMAFALVLRK